MINDHIDRLKKIDQELRSVKSQELGEISRRALEVYNEFKISVMDLNILDIDTTERVISFYEGRLERIYDDGGGR